MSWSIPRRTPAALSRGDKGIAVWSLQSGLNSSSTPLAIDGDFGPATEAAVKKFQTASKVTSDGIAGPVTQRLVIRRIVTTVDSTSLPSGLLTGFAESEGGNMLGAVNWTVAGGVDCGTFQRRVYEGDYADDHVIQRAFDTAYQASLLKNSLINLRSIFEPRSGTKDGYGGMRPREKAWRLAALNHNYPSGADRLSRTPIHELSSYWTTPQSWVINVGVKFPDGAHVRTPLEWCHLYAGVLAGAHKHKGIVTKYVTSWQ